MREYEGL